MQSNPRKVLLYSIPCYFRNFQCLTSARRTLQQIKDRCPKDLMRLQSNVRKIQPFDDADEGDLGIWIADKPTEDPATWDYGLGDTPGVIKIVENEPLEDLPGLLAHELGHAAIRFEDRERRGSISDEWQSELAADWYAYKWGFGRLIAKQRKTRDRLHHGPTPGHTFKELINGKISHYRITRSFVAHLVRTTEETNC
jgi:hypothetical protein